MKELEQRIETLELRVKTLEDLLNLVLNNAAPVSKSIDKEFLRATEVLRAHLQHLHENEGYAHTVRMTGRQLAEAVTDADSGISFGKGKKWTSYAQQWVRMNLLIAQTEDLTMQGYFRFGSAIRKKVRAA